MWYNQITKEHMRTAKRMIEFKNKIFHTLEKVMDRLWDGINSLACNMVKSIAGRELILSVISDWK